MPADDNVTPKLRAAQSRIGLAMLHCTGYWFLPYVSGIACNIAEQELIEGVLKDLGREGSKSETDLIFWFVRKKMLLLNVATYAPVVGTALQFIEVYAMGQFTIYCALQEQSFQEDKMKAEWKRVEQEILSGERLVIAYETCTGRPFPDEYRAGFESSVEVLSRIYRGVMRVPGIEPVQASVGEGARKTVHFAKATGSWIGDQFSAEKKAAREASRMLAAARMDALRAKMRAIKAEKAAKGAKGRELAFDYEQAKIKAGSFRFDSVSDNTTGTTMRSCPACPAYIRLPLGGSGGVCCPNCGKDFFAAT